MRVHYSGEKINNLVNKMSRVKINDYIFQIKIIEDYSELMQVVFNNKEPIIETSSYGDSVFGDGEEAIPTTFILGDAESHQEVGGKMSKAANNVMTPNEDGVIVLRFLSDKQTLNDDFSTHFRDLQGNIKYDFKITLGRCS